MAPHQQQRTTTTQTQTTSRATLRLTTRFQSPTILSQCMWQRQPRSEPSSAVRRMCLRLISRMSIQKRWEGYIVVILSDIECAP